MRHTIQEARGSFLLFDPESEREAFLAVPYGERV